VAAGEDVEPCKSLATEGSQRMFAPLFDLGPVILMQRGGDLLAARWPEAGAAGVGRRYSSPWSSLRWDPFRCWPLVA
jgi:hypothetical protein